MLIYSRQTDRQRVTPSWSCDTQVKWTLSYAPMGQHELFFFIVTVFESFCIIFELIVEGNADLEQTMYKT